MFFLLNDILLLRFHFTNQVQFFPHQKKTNNWIHPLVHVYESNASRVSRGVYKEHFSTTTNQVKSFPHQKKDKKMNSPDVSRLWMKRISSFEGCVSGKIYNYLPLQMNLFCSYTLEQHTEEEFLDFLHL